MKHRIAALTCVLVLVLALGACANQGSPAPSSSSPNPTSIPVEIPRPPKSELLGANDFTGAGAAGFAFGESFRSSASLDEVNAFYDRELNQDGWVIAASMPSDDPSIEGRALVAQRGAGQRPGDLPENLSVVISRKDGQGPITIDLNYSARSGLPIP